MAELKYRLVAMDLDGTLLNGRKQVSERTRRALERLHDRGVLAVLASGRMLRRMKPVAAYVLVTRAASRGRLFGSFLSR